MAERVLHRSDGWRQLIASLDLVADNNAVIIGAMDPADAGGGVRDH